MSNDIKLLSGVVNDTNPVLSFQHIRLYKDRAQAHDGSITVDVPFECGGLDVAVQGTKFLAAVKLCDAPVFKAMASGRVQVKQGAFKASIPTIATDIFPLLRPEGELIDGHDGYTEAFKIARHYTGDSARKWLNSVSIRNGNVYATDGISLVRIAVADDGPTVPLPVPLKAITKIQSINRPVTAIRVTDRSITFKLGDDVWVRVTLFNDPAPEMERLIKPCDIPVPEGLRDALEQLKPWFVGKIPEVKLDNTGVHIRSEGSDASVALSGLPDCTCRADKLLTILQTAKYMDLGAYPDPMVFNDGESVYGALAGTRA